MESTTSAVITTLSEAFTRLLKEFCNLRHTLNAATHALDDAPVGDVTSPSRKSNMEMVHFR